MKERINMVSDENELPYSVRLAPGVTVEHRCRPGVPLVIVAWARRGVSGDIYTVRTPEGREVLALRENLKSGDTLFG